MPENLIKKTYIRKKYKEKNEETIINDKVDCDDDLSLNDDLILRQSSEKCLSGCSTEEFLSSITDVLLEEDY